MREGVNESAVGKPAAPATSQSRKVEIILDRSVAPLELRSLLCAVPGVAALEIQRLHPRLAL
jgi:hypothetical protein